MLVKKQVSEVKFDPKTQKIIQNIPRIAKSCPENISLVIEVSSFFFKLKYVTFTTVTTASVITVNITTVTI